MLQSRFDSDREGCEHCGKGNKHYRRPLWVTPDLIVITMISGVGRPHTIASLDERNLVVIAAEG